MISTMTSSATSAIFSFNGTQIHTVTDDNGETWFSAGDICAVLGYSNDSEAIEKYCREKGIAKRAPHAEGENPGLTYGMPNSTAGAWCAMRRMAALTA